jgi:hypothetical protein
VAGDNAPQVGRKEPFGKLPTWVVDLEQLQQLKPNALRVYVALVVLGDNTTRNCWPSQGTLVKKAGVARSSISAAVSQLRDLGLIKTWRRGYRVVYHVEMVPPPFASWTVEDDKCPRNSDTYQREGETGRFASEDLGRLASEDLGREESEKLGRRFKSSSGF